MAITRPYDTYKNGREVRNINKDIGEGVRITTASQGNNNLIFNLKKEGQQLKVEELGNEQKVNLLKVLQELDPEVKTIGNSVLNYGYYN